MDGLDICVADIHCAKHTFQPRSLASRIVPFPPDLREAIRASLSGPTEHVCEAHYRLGRFYAEETSRFLSEVGIRGIDGVGSHGQTVHHVSGVATLQIGEPSFLAEELGVPVVSDFRARDISLGGTGAPLIPFVDKCLFQQADSSVVSLNIGGIANITYIPPTGSHDDVTGFDTGPGMSLFDEAARLWGMATSEAEQRAFQGKPSEALATGWMKDPFIEKRPPKSTGRDYFGLAWLERNVPHLRDQNPQDLLASLCFYTARAVALNCKLFVDLERVSQVIVAGGGVHSRPAMEMLRSELAPIQVASSEKLGIDPDMKEALGFAILAAAYFRGVPANLPSVTGASKAVVLGKLTI